MDDLTENVNKFLKNKNIKFQFNTLGFVILLICIIILTCWGIIHICLKICCNDEDIALEIKKLEEHFNKVNKAKEEEKNKQEKNQREKPKLLCPNCVNDNLLKAKSMNKINKRKVNETEFFEDKMREIHEYKSINDIKNIKKKITENHSLKK